MNDHVGYSRDATAIATGFGNLNRSLNNFLTILSLVSAVRNPIRCSRNRDVI